MLTIVTWKWSTPGYRSSYTGAHVNALARMVAKHYPHSHRVACVTNEPEGINRWLVDVVPDRAHFADLKSPHGSHNPSCYRRLLAFHPQAARLFGPRFVSIDLDTVITGDMTPLWDRDEDFVAWRDPYRGGSGQYCGAMWLLRAGSRPDVWERFAANPAGCQLAAAAAGFRGSDQAWISHAARGAPTWTQADGVYSYRADLREGAAPLPDAARVVMFHGRFDPWDEGPQRLSWVRVHWGQTGYAPTDQQTTTPLA